MIAEEYEKSSLDVEVNDEKLGLWGLLGISRRQRKDKGTGIDKCNTLSS